MRSTKSFFRSYLTSHTQTIRGQLTLRHEAAILRALNVIATQIRMNKPFGFVNVV
jgi:hypothetical protein